MESIPRIGLPCLNSKVGTMRKEISILISSAGRRVELVQSFLTMQTILVFGLVYWIGSVYLDYGDND